MNSQTSNNSTSTNNPFVAKSKIGKINRTKDQLFKIIGITATASGLIILAFFILDILKIGLTRIDWDFITSFPSRKAEISGILSSLTGSAWLLVLTMLFALPLGVAAGLYFEEYANKSRFNDILEINIANLAGVPSIIYGILGLEIFNRVFGLGSSLLAGAFTLALLILPIIIVATREAVKAVPSTLREASYGLGATKWQTTKWQVLPAASGGILTGSILALSRAIGEAAPLIVVGAVAYAAFIPTSPLDQFTVMPIQIFDWTSRPHRAFHVNAAAAIIILLMITFMMNGIAIYFRNKWQKTMK